MKKHEKLSNEQRLMILTSRLTFSAADEIELQAIMKAEIDWFYILAISIKNKILPLLWYNLSKRNYKMGGRTGQVAHYYYLGNKERNKIYFDELNKVLNAALSNNITCIPLKGSFLIPNMYKDLGIRLMNDIDCMIMKFDTNNIRKTMNEIAYFESDYDQKENRLVKISRSKDILWKTKMNSLHPFRKLSDSEYLNYVEVDFSHSLDLDLSTEPVEDMIYRSVKRENDLFKSLKLCDFFVHLCCHLYKEATNTMWVHYGSDINLIKFCDVREFIINFMDEKAKKEAIEFTAKYKLQKAVYFTIFYLKEIYNDGYESKMLDLLDIDDDSFLNFYGENEYGESTSWKKSFWQRLFSETNADELKQTPKFLEIT